ncbi:MAG: hypothetical protein IJ745_04270 [Bacteroidales bacterium]|nr:hypothetical protein [Bacteroidales bacterium]
MILKPAKTMLLMAAAAMFLAACGKEGDAVEPSAATLADVEGDALILDGQTLRFAKEVGLEENGFYFAHTVMLSADGTADTARRFDIGLHHEDLGYTYSLATPDGCRLSVEMHWPGDASFSMEMVDDDVYSSFNGLDVDELSAFDSGVIVSRYDDDTLRVEFSGTLRDGRALAFRCATPRSDIADWRNCEARPQHGG